MAMGHQEVNRLQLILFDVVDNGCALLRIEGTTVYDDTFLGFIAHNVAILLEHVDLKSFYM